MRALESFGSHEGTRFFKGNIDYRGRCSRGPKAFEKRRNLMSCEGHRGPT